MGRWRHVEASAGEEFAGDVKAVVLAGSAWLGTAAATHEGAVVAGRGRRWRRSPRSA